MLKVGDKVRINPEAKMLKVGDKVRINPAYGVHFYSGVTLTVERVSGRELHLVLNPQPDGSADYRTRESRERLVPVRPSTDYAEMRAEQARARR
jgi:hypothetical protein